MPAVPSIAAGPPHDDTRVTDLGRLLLGLSVVALGILFLLDAADVLDAGRAIGRWWPLLLVGAGVLTLLERPPAVVRGLLLTAIGGALLLFTTDAVNDNAWDYVWPAAVILAGLVVLSRWSGWAIAVPDAVRPDDVVRATALFGGPKIASASQDFRGAWVTAIFGGAKLDLRAARPAAGGASINATAAFGGIEILVPRGWRIGIRSTPIFGGVDDKTDRAADPPDDAPVLQIDAVCLFGGVDIKHDEEE